ncbi:cell wall assembly regulator SMI1 [Actinocorallia herbida]|uniref:Cell wall assembly regulator SMI1 n=1 Tax=Actinocorallia herbida TaxID=58109 RepID=A0A3N1CSK6_9ACTN|nr:SMI1/KNR4 family protein [Actinocorallia herbida]ROO84301.1 cell wall assembly regulator SMI1 [Actinocorallia herbida]
MDGAGRAELVEVCGLMAAAVRAAGPPDWARAVVRAHATGLRGAGHVVYETPGGRVRRPLEDADEAIANLVRLAKGPTPGLDVALRVEPSGGYEASVTPRTARGLSGGVCLLEPGLSRPPEGGSQPGPERDSPAGDPGEAVRLMDAYLAELDRVLGREPSSRTPTPDALLADVERSVGRALPPDLRALYAAGHHDDGFPWRWLPPEEIPGEHGYIAHADLIAHPVLDADPAETVRCVRTHEAWIPFAYDGDGTYLLVDLAPARFGRPGQVVCTGTAIDDGPAYVAESVTALLRRQLGRLRDGAYTLDPDGEYLEFHADLWHQGLQRARRHLVADPATPLVPDARLQDLTVRGVAGFLDLAPLAAAPRLKSLKALCGSTDLAPLAALPLENLDLTADADLAPLAGHPALRSLALATTTPVHLTLLRTLPRLESLDLSRAPVPDLELLPDLPALRSLTLALPQWEELWRRTDRHPRLAVAALHGDPDSATRAAWAATLPSAPATTPLLHHTATLPT